MNGAIAYGWAVGLSLWIIAACVGGLILGAIVRNRDTQVPTDTNDTEETDK